MPAEVVTEMLPLVPDPITAVILVGETILNDVAAVPPKLTAVAPVKLVPVSVTVEPNAAVDGLIVVMVGTVTEFIVMRVVAEVWLTELSVILTAYEPS